MIRFIDVYIHFSIDGFIVFKKIVVQNVQLHSHNMSNTSIFTTLFEKILQLILIVD